MYGRPAIGPSMRLSVNDVLSNTEKTLTNKKAIGNPRGALRTGFARFPISPSISVSPIRVTVSRAGLTNRRVVVRDHNDEMVIPPVVIHRRRSNQTEDRLMAPNSRASDSPVPVLRTAIRKASSSLSSLARKDITESRRCDSSSSRSCARKLGEPASFPRQRWMAAFKSNEVSFSIVSSTLCGP